MKTWISAGMFLTVMLLTGCGLFQTKVETRTLYVTVPKSLYPNCPETYYGGETVGEALNYLPDLYSLYSLCRSDVQVLIEYLEDR
ncbi:Rz1-like lysis system protein LysC [Sinomicrobium sp.]